MLQLGFDIEYTDATTGKPVPWASFDPKMVREIAAAGWKIVDLETTGLTPASAPVKLSGKKIRQGANALLRTRVASILYPRRTGGLNRVAFDFDKLSSEERSQVARAALSNTFFNHNAGFDVYWLRQLTTALPDRVLDSMLLARALAPDIVVRIAKMSTDESEEPQFQAWAQQFFIEERSGWSLADVAAVLLRKFVAKDRQGPANWCEPFLDQRSYDYATGDVQTTYEILCHLFGIPADGSVDLLEAYFACKRRDDKGILELLEPQVLEIVLMREHGMPISPDAVYRYFEECTRKAVEGAKRLVQIEPSLARFERLLADMKAGTTEELKTALGQAFENRGLILERTDKEQLPKIGEKDLRKVEAEARPETAALFAEWVGICKAKKAGGMALEVLGFAQRSPDGMVHSLTTHGPVTGRLAAQEPNVQQFPRDPTFRAIVAAYPGNKIVAVDFSALDMRVGAALAIRAQREIMEAYFGQRPVAPDVLAAIEEVITASNYQASVARLHGALEKVKHALARHKQKMPGPDASSDARKAFWDQWRRISRKVLLTRFRYCLAAVLAKAQEAQTSEWGSLRDAFMVPGMDIHTWTTLGMMGNDPKALFSGKSDPEIAAELKRYKHELGDKRQAGKVGNLALLYAMEAAGFKDYAAKGYNIHWSLEEAGQIRDQWHATYIEINLWHAWTELNPVEEVWMPDSERGGRITKKAVYASYTLADRLIYAFGLNAALSYQDQSSGADILSRAMHVLWAQYRDAFDCIINQVHDEIVFMIPDEKVEGYTRLIVDVMNGSAEHYIGPYGIRSDVSPAVGEVWIKD